MDRIPLFPLGVVLLPGMRLPLHIFEERYKQMISDCLAAKIPFGIVLFDGRSIRSVGCMARVEQVLHRYEDGRMDILTRGEQRFLIQGLIEEKPYMEAQVAFFDDEDPAPSEDPQVAPARARELMQKLAESGLEDQLADPQGLSRPKDLSFAVPALEGFSPAERQQFLEMTSTAERLQKCIEALARITERARLTEVIQKIIGGNGHPPPDALRRLSSEEAH